MSARSTRTLLLPVLLAVVVLLGGCSKSSTTAAPAPVVPASAGQSPLAASPSAGADAACPTSNTTAFAKTKFVLHTGLAFGAFHRYLYKPYQSGSFTTGSTTHKVLQASKAGLSALYIKREVRLAIVDVQANPTLCSTLIAPLRSVADTLDGTISKLKSGDTSGITSTQSLVSTVEGGAAKNGAPITEDPNAPAA